MTYTEYLAKKRKDLDNFEKWVSEDKDPVCALWVEVCKEYHWDGIFVTYRERWDPEFKAPKQKGQVGQ